MRLLYATLVFLPLAGSTSGGWCGQFPYAARVDTDQTAVRSGPGENFYATDRLPRDAMVEVYRHDPNGWFAIRPPDGSFSWVRAVDVEMGDRLNTAVVVSENAITHVGSRSSDAHAVPYVQLHRGEAVRVLGSKRFTDGETGNIEAWLQIAPPAGEFRWIHGTYLTRIRGRLAANDANDGDDGDDGNDANDDDSPTILVPGDDASELVPGDNVSEAGDVRTASHDEPIRSDFSNNNDTHSGQWKKATSGNTAPSAAPTAPVTSPTAPVTSPTAPVTVPTAGNLSALRIALARMVSREVDQWRLDELRRSAETAMASATSADGRGRAESLLERIATFEEIKRDHDRLVAAKIGGQWSDGLNQTAGPSIRPNPAGKGIDSRFDATGWLMPVIIRRRGVPAYALTDDFGRVQRFVTPAPGVNLNRYLRKEVGIYGQGGYLEQFKRPHLTAERVVTMKRR